MDLGTKMHKSLQMYLQSWRNYKAQELLKEEYDPATTKFTDQVLALADRCELPTLVATELPYKAEFQVGDDTLAITGTVDGIVDTGHMIDIKSSKWLRQESQLQYKRQRRIYPVLYALARGKTEWMMKFDYRIFTKQVKPQFQKFEMDVDISQHLDTLKRIAEQYVLAERSGIFEPNINSSACYYCPFAKDGTCPGKNKSNNFF